MTVDFALLYTSFSALLHGTIITVKISIFGCFFGILFGTLFGISLTLKNRFLYWIVSSYAVLVRGTPMLTQIFIVRYVFPQFGLSFSLLWTAIIAIAINSAAYISYIIRAGINAVSVGQIEAAETLGFSRIQIARYIVLPQAFRIILPMLGNELITLVKDSSLASTIGVVELTKAGNQIRGATFDAITPLFAVALIYLSITTALSCLFSKYEKNMDLYATH